MMAIKNARIWQWSDAALAGPSAMLAAAARGEAHAPFADWMTFVWNAWGTHLAARAEKPPTFRRGHFEARAMGLGWRRSGTKTGL